MMLALTHFSKTHTWLLPVFAVGLGAPLWCQVRCISLTVSMRDLDGVWIDPVGNVFACTVYSLGGNCRPLSRSLVVALAWCLGCRAGCRSWNDSASGTRDRWTMAKLDVHVYLVRHSPAYTCVSRSSSLRLLVRSVSWWPERLRRTPSDLVQCSPTSAPGISRRALRAVRWPRHRFGLRSSAKSPSWLDISGSIAKNNFVCPMSRVVPEGGH